MRYNDKKRIKPIPCPWCGATPEVKVTNRNQIYYACSNTGCKIQPVQVVDYCSLEEAAIAWNERQGGE